MKISRRRTGSLLLAGAALVVLPLAASPASQAATSAAPPARSAAGYPAPDWIIQQDAVTALLKTGMAQTQLQQLFGNQRTYLVYQPKDGFKPTLKGVVNTYPASDETTLYNLLDHKNKQGVYTGAGLPKAVGAVLFDIENWGNTPAPEPQHPIDYMSRAAADVASYNQRTGRHIQFIAAPAPDLTTAVMPHYVDNRTYPTNYNGYLKLGLAGNAARVSDALDIQGQQIENTPKVWGSFVAAAAAQAKKANPNVTILVGLTLNPKTYTTHPITAKQLKADYCQERGYNGYWLNIAAGTATKYAASFLRLFLADNGNVC